MVALKERSCIVTRTVRPRDELIRFVLDPEDRVVPDLKGVLPGRGVWVTARADLIAKAVERKLFAKAFRGEAKADAGLVDMVGSLLLRRALDLLGMAKRAGQVMTGFFKVDEMIGEGKAGVLIEARDGSEDGRRKLRNRFQAALADTGFEGDGVERVVSCFTIEQLSLALGRTNVVHAALIKGRLGEEFLAVARRHEAYRA
jgi:predicted RNA-binding protein YlxR (DUF448 family)